MNSGCGLRSSSVLAAYMHYRVILDHVIMSPCSIRDVITASELCTNKNLQCTLDISLPFYSKDLTKTHTYLARRREVWVCVVSFNFVVNWKLQQCSTILAVVLCSISYWIWPQYIKILFQIQLTCKNCDNKGFVGYWIIVYLQHAPDLIDFHWPSLAYNTKLLTLMCLSR